MKNFIVLFLIVLCGMLGIGITLSDFTFDEYSVLYGVWQVSQKSMNGIDFGSTYPTPFFAVVSPMMYVFPLDATQLIIAKWVVFACVLVGMTAIWKTTVHWGVSPLLATLIISTPLCFIWGSEHLVFWRGITEFRVDQLAIAVFLIGIFVAEKWKRYEFFLLAALISITFTPRGWILILPISIYYTWSSLKQYGIKRSIFRYIITFTIFVPMFFLFNLGDPYHGWIEIVASHITPLENEYHGKFKFFSSVFKEKSYVGWYLLLIPFIGIIKWKSPRTWALTIAYLFYAIYSYAISTQWCMWMLLIHPLLIANAISDIHHGSILNRLTHKQTSVLKISICIIVLYVGGKNIVKHTHESHIISDISLHKQRDYHIPKDTIVMGESFGWPLFRTNMYNYILLDQPIYRDVYISRKSEYDQQMPEYINLFATMKLPEDRIEKINQLLQQHKAEYIIIKENYDGWGEIKSIPALIKR
jgi:hypothetical protein